MVQSLANDLPGGLSREVCHISRVSGCSVDVAQFRIQIDVTVEIMRSNLLASCQFVKQGNHRVTVRPVEKLNFRSGHGIGLVWVFMGDVSSDYLGWRSFKVLLHLQQLGSCIQSRVIGGQIEFCHHVCKLQRVSFRKALLRAHFLSQFHSQDLLICICWGRLMAIFVISRPAAPHLAKLVLKVRLL